MSSFVLLLILSGLVKKLDACLPVAGKTIYYAIISARAKMLGKSYIDVLTLLHFEFTLPETEETWKRRQDLLIQLCEIFETRKENTALPKDFLERLKAILPEISGAATSERTTLSAQACRAISHIAKGLETQIQPQLDIVLPQLIAHCGSTKAVNQKNASEAIINICKHAGFNSRLFYHVCSAFRDKRVPPRIYAPEWLRILIKNYRSQMDRDRDGEAVRKAIFQGLTDGQIKVRENSRAVYWEYATYDVQGSRMIMGGLNSHAAAALREDPHNPDKSSAKAAKVSRPGSALAQIKAQSKQQLHPRRGFTPASVKPEDFVFGSLEDVDAVAEKQPAPKGANEHSHDKQDKHIQDLSQGKHQGESAGGSRHGASTQSRPVSQKSSKDSKLEGTKDLKASSPQVEARPLLSAPVRRGRIVATPIAPVSNPARPSSRGELTKKLPDIRDKTASEKSTGRQTPVTHRERDPISSATTHHRKTGSRQETLKAGERDISSLANSQNGKSNGRQTPVIAEDKEPFAPSTIQSTKKADRLIPVIVEDDATSANALPRHPKDNMTTEQVMEQFAPPGTLPLRPVRPFAPENQAIPPTDLAGDKNASRQYIPEGKENTSIMRPRKKKSPSQSPHRSPTRSSPQRSPRRNSIASAKKSLATAAEFLRHGTLDALGYRRLRKLIETHPSVLITRQAQFNELFELLISNLSSLDELTESRDKRPGNLNHPAYNRHTILITLIDLFHQYPQWPEPHPGMTLCALLIARCNHSTGYASVMQAIDDSAYLLCTYSQNPLPTIDAVLDTLEQIEHIITTNDPIVTPNSGTTIFHNSLQSLASEFGPERPRFANRLPIVMAFGLKVLNALLARLTVCNQTLFTIQEDRLASFAEHLLATYTSIIKRHVMEYCIALHAVIKPEKRFYSFFSKESDKNLIYYYVAGASGMVTGSLGSTGGVVMPESDLDFMESEPSTFDPSTEMSAQWKFLGSSATDRAAVPTSGKLTVNALRPGTREVAASEESGNWQVLGVTAEE